MNNSGSTTWCCARASVITHYLVLCPRQRDNTLAWLEQPQHSLIDCTDARYPERLKETARYPTALLPLPAFLCASAICVMAIVELIRRTPLHMGFGAHQE